MQVSADTGLPARDPLGDAYPVREDILAQRQRSRGSRRTPAHARHKDNEGIVPVLARAVRWHAEHRILLNGNKTVVFR